MPRILGLVLAAVLCLGAGSTSPRALVAAPATVVGGLPFAVTVRMTPAPSGAVFIRASSGDQAFIVRAAGSRGVYRAKLRLPAPGSWILTARVTGRDRAERTVRATPAQVVHPLAVTVVAGGVIVADGASGRIVRIGARGPVVHATGFVEPTGLAPAPGGGLLVADFTAGAVRRIGPSGQTSELARLEGVTSVAAAGNTAYAVSMGGVLAGISGKGAITRIAVPGGLDRPHGIAVDRDGTLLVGEDSRRVRRIDPASGRATLVVGNVDTNKIAVASDGTLYLAGATLTGGTLRRLSRDGELLTLVSGLRVSDVAVLPDGDLVITTVEPAAVLRVDPRTGARSRFVP